MCVERAFGPLKMVFRVLTGSESCLKAETERIPIYILLCLVMHNFPKELGHVVDQRQTDELAREGAAGDAARPERLAEPAGGAAREYRDRLCRLWVDGAAE